MMLKTALAAALVLLASVQAQAAAVLSPNPVVINMGSPVHLTPRDQDGNAIPIALCVVEPYPSTGLPATLATVSYDPTGAVLTAVGPGSGSARWKCTAGTTTVYSAQFGVSVPWNVTAVGHSSP